MDAARFISAEIDSVTNTPPNTQWPANIPPTFFFDFLAYFFCFLDRQYQHRISENKSIVPIRDAA